MISHKQPSRWPAFHLRIAVAVLSVALSCTRDAGRAQSGDNHVTDAVFARVLRTDTIRAGYVSYAPGTIIDPQTKVVSGIFPDLLRKIAVSAGLEVAFVEEATYATLIEGLQRGRYDVVGGVWANPNRAKAATLSNAVYFSPVEIWVRKQSRRRFDVSKSFTVLNDSSVRIGAIDGSTPLGIAKSQFPKAKLQSYPNITQESQLFIDLRDGRIDVFFAEPSQASQFLRSNPGTIERLPAPRPLRTFANVFVIPTQELQMKVFFDNAILDLQTSGVVDEILARYESTPGAFLRVALPYQR